MKKYLLIIFCLFLTSCSFDKIYENREEDKNEAQKITEKFYYFLQQDNNSYAFKLFSNNFFKVTNQDKLSQVIDKTKNEYGKIQSDSLSNWRTHVTKGSNPISKYEMTYQVKREIGNTQEVITLQKENDTVKIIGYRIDFDIVPQK